MSRYEEIQPGRGFTGYSESIAHIRPSNCMIPVPDDKEQDVRSKGTRPIVAACL